MFYIISPFSHPSRSMPFNSSLLRSLSPTTTVMFPFPCILSSVIAIIMCDITSLQHAMSFKHVFSPHGSSVPQFMLPSHSHCWNSYIYLSCHFSVIPHKRMSVHDMSVSNPLFVGMNVFNEEEFCLFVDPSPASWSMSHLSQKLSQHPNLLPLMSVNRDNKPV